MEDFQRKLSEYDVRKEFPKKVIEQARFRAAGLCEMCNLPYAGRPVFDHILPDGLGGMPTLDNCQVLCQKCNRLKTFAPVDGDNAKMSKADRIREKHQGIRKSKYKWPKRKMT